jgi:hypothetical protein
MITGKVVNNTGKSKHIFKRTVYPGHSVDLAEVHKLLSSKVPEGDSFITWLQGYIPTGWEVHGEELQEETGEVSEKVGRGIDYVPEIIPEDSSPSLQYISTKKISELSAKDIHDLRVKDNPRRIINEIDSVTKLRRALTLCNKSKRKEVLSKIIKARINKLR